MKKIDDENNNLPGDKDRSLIHGLEKKVFAARETERGRRVNRFHRAGND